MTMTCRSCGAECNPAADTCDSCGSSLDPVGSAATMVGGIAPVTGFGPDTAASCAGPGAAERAREATTLGLGATIGAPTTGGATLDSTTFSPGQAFGPRYRIEALLGLGGMGAVYRAWDAELAMDVALKVIRPEIAADPAAARELQLRFKRELLLARQVTHKNVVRIHDLGEVDGIKYITMPFIEGHELAAILKREGPLPVERALHILRGVVAGLEAAHAAGVVHRDLKPANIMVAADDEAMIMDFGIARLSEPSGAAAGGPEKVGARPAAGSTAFLRESLAADGRTRLGAVVGTIEYMAPEQARGMPVDQRADIYALGLIILEMLSGVRKFASTTDALADLATRMKEPLPPLRSLNANVPETVATLVDRCLRPSADERWQSSAELEAALDEIDDHGVPRPHPPKLLRSPRFWMAATALVAALVGGTWWATVKLGPQPQPKAHEVVSVLIGDVENATGDTVFDGAVEETLGRAIEGASFIDVYPRKSAAALAAKLKPGGRLDEGTGRLVARSEGIHVLMIGAVGRRGNEYTVSVRALDPSAEGTKTKPLAEFGASAPTRERALQAIGTLGAQIRGPLGDTTSEAARLAAAETFTTSSAEAVKTYTLAQDLLFSGRTAEAFDAYKRAIEQDPGFGRAYAGAGIAAQRLGRDGEAQELWKKALSLTDRMTEREKHRTLGGYYLNVARNYEKAKDSYRALVEAFPADRAGHASLALAYFWALDIPRALEEEKRALDLDPKSVLARVNYALYAMYAGDFETAARETARVIAQQPSLDLAYVPLATAALAAGDSAGALQSYASMARTGASGASLAATGLADLAMYEGRYADVEKILKPAIGEDEKSENLVGQSAKWLVLAEAYEAMGKSATATAAARKSLTLGKGQPSHVLAASVLIRAGLGRDATAVAAAFAQRLEPQSRAYGKILEGRAALRERRFADAVDAFTAAQKLADLWMARFDLGVAFVEAEHFAEGLAEIERCQKRRGEATAIFLDEVPSFRYLATLPYWLARAQAGVGQSQAAADSFRTYLALRSAAPNDPLAADARRRLGGR
jgi:eukaryotic-like serine/threonine-protein kinase